VVWVLTKYNQIMGNNNKKVYLYALSTCVWCQRCKGLLDEMGVDYDYVFVDQLAGSEKEKVVAELMKHNPSRSFPTIVIDGEVIIGFKEDAIKELLSK
jgi:glutaredoxin